MENNWSEKELTGYPSELSKSEYVERCTVVGIKDNVVGYKSIAFVILKDKSADTQFVISELNKRCRESCPRVILPMNIGF